MDNDWNKWLRESANNVLETDGERVSPPDGQRSRPVYDLRGHRKDAAEPTRITTGEEKPPIR